MAYLVVLILHEPEKSIDLLDAWEEVGVGGVTILESTGLGRVRRAGLRDDLPLVPSLMDLLRADENPSRMFFSVVETETLANQLGAAAQRVVGDFEKPQTGLFFILPVSKVLGIHKIVD